MSAKLVPTSADIGCHVVSVTDPYGRILGFNVLLHIANKNKIKKKLLPPAGKQCPLDTRNIQEDVRAM
jgi:hypothetical protein